jgi:undecaprenyl-diphosphatase
MHAMNAPDRAIFYFINRWPDALDPVMRFFSLAISHWPLRVALAVLALAMIVRGARARATAIQALIAWPIANGLTDLLKNSLCWPRPYAQLTDVLHRTTQTTVATASAHTDWGTASAHAANMAAIATVWTACLGWRWGSIWIGIAIVTGLSRIYLGMHYPSEVLLGWFCGIAAGLLVVKGGSVIQAKLSRVRNSNEPNAPDNA